MRLHLWITNAANSGWRPMERVSQIDLEGAASSRLQVQREHFGTPAETSVSRKNHLTVSVRGDDAIAVSAGEGRPVHLRRAEGGEEPVPSGKPLALGRVELAGEGVVLSVGRRFLRLYLTEERSESQPTIGTLGGTEGPDGTRLEALLALYRATPAERLERARSVARDVLRAELVPGARAKERRKNVYVSREGLEPLTIRRDDKFSPADLALCERIAELMTGPTLRPPPISPDGPKPASKEPEELHEMAQEYLGGDDDPASVELREDLVRLAIELARRLKGRSADEPLPVLALSGEPGVGKNWIVKLLVKMVSSVAGKALPCESLNLAAVTPTIAESELFGVAPGAVTGVRERTGAFVRADGGVIFLDEVGRAFELQKKLFQVLDSGSFYPVGAQSLVSVNAIVVVAYNGRATDLVKSGTMDDAFASRLGVPFAVPSLVGRPHEVARLVRMHLEKRRADTPGLDDAAVETITDALAAQSSWPGNHRQIRAIVDRICDLRRFQRERVLEVYESTVGVSAETRGPRVVAPWSKGWRTHQELDEARDRALYDAYVTLRASGKTGRAIAKLLGTKDPTLRSWIKEWESKGWASPS